MEITQPPSQLMERIRAVSLFRRVRLPEGFDGDDAGRIAADILRLSAEGMDDIMLLIPPRGTISGALSLAQLLKLPSMAPTVGVLCGAVRTSALVLLQACTVRVLSRHAELAPSLLEREHEFPSIVFEGPAEQIARTRREVADALEQLQTEQTTAAALVSERLGVTQDALLAVLATRPEYSAPEALAAGWADAVI